MRIWFLAAYFCFITSAWAAEEIAPLPPALAANFTQAAPHGQGSYYWGIFHVYDAALWTDATDWSYGAPFALTLRYRIDAHAKDIADETIKQLRLVSDLTPAQLESFAAELGTLYPEMKTGDTITAAYSPGKPAAIYHNSELRGTIREAAFIRPFFSIWLSERTSEPKLRAKLLGIR